MKKDENSSHRASSKRRVFEYAPQTGVDDHKEIAADFMRRIMDYEPEDYVISDESHLSDFDDGDRNTIDKKVLAVYGVDISDIKGNLLAIFQRLRISQAR